MVSCTLRKYLLGKSHLGAQILNMAHQGLNLGILGVNGRVSKDF